MRKLNVVGAHLRHGLALHNDTLVRAKQVHGPHGFLPVSRSTFFSWVSDGTLPKPFKVSAGVSLWRVGDLLSALGLNPEVAP